MSRTPAEPHGGTGTARERLSDLAETIGAEKLDRYQEVLAQLEPRQLVALVARLERAQSWDQVAKVVGPDSADDARATVTEALCGLAGAEGADLEEVALAVADRLAIDWPARLDQAKDEHEREVLEQLRLADEVAEACWTQPTSPKRLGDFEILRELGRGGMGVVYEARQISLKRRVALKVLPAALGMGSHARQRFEREAQAAAKLHHTNIVPVHAIGEHDGHHFYAMDLIEGQSLDHVLLDLADEGSNPLLAQTVTRAASELTQERPAPTESTHAMSSQGGDVTSSLGDTSAGSRPWFDAVAKLIAEVADGLDYAHGRGVIHRDIKPANLMLSGEGRLCITDFGLARIVQEPGMTVSGSFLGTPAYMSPEQIAAGRMKLDHRTDVYSLGAVLYELLTLHRPFPGDSREEVIGAIMTKDPRAPRKFNGKIPQDLETICLKALEKDPDRRYATAGAFAQDLREYLRHGLIAARRAGIVRRTWKTIRRHPTAATVVVAVLIVAAVAVVAWQAGGRSEEAQRLVADARLALREGVYREGLELIDRAVELDPEDIEARLVRARLLVVQYRIHEAAAETRWVLAREAQNVGAHAILACLALHPLRHYKLRGTDPVPHLQSVEAAAQASAEVYLLRALSTKDTRKRIELLDKALDLNPGDQLASLARMLALAHLKDHQLELSEADRLIAARPRSSQGWRMKAGAYRKLREFERARAAVARAFAVDGGDSNNYIQRAWIHRDAGELEAAVEDLTRAIELDPEHAFIYTVRATHLNSLGRFEESIADARRSIELNPDDLGGFTELLRPYLNLGRVDEVRATLDKLRARADGWFDVEEKANAYMTIADYDRRLKDYDRAMDSVERAIEINPDDFWGFIVRMRIHRELGNDAAADADCDAAARIELGEPADLKDRGRRLALDCHDFVKAIEDFNRVIESAPKWHLAYFERGYAQFELQRLDQALTDLDSAIELAPYDPSPYATRAEVYYQQGRWEECLRDWRRALELGPNSSYRWADFGVRLLDLGRIEEALAAQDKALELAPRNGIAHANRGIMLAWLGRCDEAVGELRQAEDYSPLHFAAHANIAEAYLFPLYFNCTAHYDMTEALRHAQFAYDAMPERMRSIQADALFRKGDYPKAKRLYLKSFEDTPHGMSWFPLAMCLWHLGEKGEALEFYDRSVTWMEGRQPDNPLLVRQRQEAAELFAIQP